MSREYIKPRFKSIKPYSILKSISEIEKSKYYNPHFILDNEPSEDKFKITYRKFENNEELTTKEYKILAYYLHVINKHGNLNIYFNSFNSNFNRFVGYRGFVRPLLSFIYNYELRSIACKTTYEAVKKVINKLKDKEKFKNVVELTKKIDGKLTDLNVKFDNAKKVIDYFYNEPYSSRKKIADALEMPDSTVNGVVNELKRVNIIKETTGFSKNQIFVFTEYVNIFLS